MAENDRNAPDRCPTPTDDKAADGRTTPTDQICIGGLNSSGFVYETPKKQKTNPSGPPDIYEERRAAAARKRRHPSAETETEQLPPTKKPSMRGL